MFTPKGSKFPSGRPRPGSRSGTPLSGPRRGPGTPLLASRLKAGLSTPVSRSQVLETTGSHVAAVWGSSLPVTVTEVLTLSSDCAGEVTVSLGRNGWAWLVSGRRLVIWRYRAGGGRAQCRELSLPPSDLAHRAELCLVYSQGEGGHTPCCLAVSPEGVVRYWPSIAQEGTSTEISAELGGQECFSVTDIHPVGSLLATTTATLVLIHHTGQSLACRRLAAPSGLLGGLGRRVSSLLWGSMPAGGAGEGRMVSVAAKQSEEDLEDVFLYVLTSNGLQKWQLGVGEPDKLYYECDIASLARDAMWPAWTPQGGEGGGSSAWLRLWLVDLAVSCGGQVAVLVAAVNQHDTTPSVQYGVAQVRTATTAPPISLSSFCLLPSLSSVLGEGEEPKLYKLVTVGDWAYVYNREGVSMVELNGTEAVENKISSHVLGAGQSEDTPLFFSSHHGVVSLSLARPPTPDISSPSTTAPDMNKTSRLCESLNVSVSAAGLENLTMSESLTDQLKAAFLQFCKRSNAQAEAIIEELFPVEDLVEPIDSTLDRLVVGLSKDLIDDFPASDPRWVESLPQSGTVGVASSMSLLVLHQLEDKLTCHQILITFLKSVGLWPRLTAITHRSQPTATVVLLSEHAEKTVGAVTLRKIHMDHQMVIDQAIRMCLTEREVTASGNLTDQDHFYREISRIDDIVSNLVGVVRFSVRSDCPREVFATIQSVNSVVLTVFKECLAARNKRMTEFLVTTQHEYLPWTSMKRSVLLELVKLTLEHGVAAAEEHSQKVELYQQVVQLSDTVLDGYNSQLDSLKGNPEKMGSVEKCFTRDRSMLVGLLVDRKVYEEAASLAEKYQEWDMLVRICEETNNKDRLEQYMEQYSSTSFSSHVFSWYVKEGKQNRLLSLSKAGRTPELASFLTTHSNISWLHDINTENFTTASQTLSAIALKEGDILARKKTQLSLAKLSALACDDEDIKAQQLGMVDQEMCLVAAQEQLPTQVLGQFGFDRESMRVLSPREMIELYVGEENIEADHIEFKKALDLLNFVNMEEEEKTRTWLHIWCRAILRNTWTDIDKDNPIESVRDTVFFRLVEFAFMQGADLATYLPKPEMLLECEELEQLRNDQNFQYLLQTGYEQLQRVCAY